MDHVGELLGEGPVWIVPRACAPGESQSGEAWAPALMGKPVGLALGLGSHYFLDMKKAGADFPCSVWPSSPFVASGHPSL